MDDLTDTVSEKQLKRFIKIRNESGFASNLQFQFDAHEAGFKVDALGTVEKTAEGYRWHVPPHGYLIEEAGQLRLESDE